MAKKKEHTSTQTLTHTPPAREPNRPNGEAFPVVCLGASAGGLEALKAFFSSAPKKCGIAYVIVVHMTPKQPSLMSELLQKVTSVPVTQAKDGEIVTADHIYVIPPNKEIRIFKGTIQLLEVLDKHITLPIDTFLKSLALDCGANAGAVILSGTGTDGTQGIKEIKARDGLVLVQSEKSAGYDGMPRSAITTGIVDMTLIPEEMPGMLCQYFNRRPNPQQDKSTAAPSGPQQWLNKIFALLRSRLGHDFSDYKINTIQRRVNRRMGLNQIESQELYVRFLRAHPEEVEALFRELLIGVTSFFRDPDSYDILKKDILPGLLDQIKDDSTMRVWVPGCSTGEEVYSLAMAIHESLADETKRIHLQLFGTDIDSRAIDKARVGLYPANIAADVGEIRLKRFFSRKGDFYQVRKEIRDSAIFSAQDIIKDPPFSRLHLLCCRNLLIYLDNHAQKKLLPLFHYTLLPEGVLMLGSSETIGGFSNLFHTLDKKWKIFKRKEVPGPLRQLVHFPSGPTTTETPHNEAHFVPEVLKTDIGQMAQKAILEQLPYTAILIDAQGNLLHIQGRSGKYLEPPSGPPTNNILDMARAGLRIELSSAIRAAKSTSKQVVRQNIIVKSNGDRQMIDLQVRPLSTPKELAGNLLLIFEEATATAIDELPTGKKGKKAARQDRSDSRLADLERELQNTRESHQTTIEELESSNEELKSTNEELQSSNEELQSTNEELESSKEELQSLNEELQTVNAELQSKVDELSAAHDDMRNLLNSTEVATIFVDNALHVKRFTKEATAIINLIHTDIGRPLKHVVTNLVYDGMMADLAGVIEDLTPRALEVQTQNGQWYNMRIIPYRTTDNRIDGAVLTFAAIDDQKKAQTELKKTRTEMAHAWQLVRNVFDMNASPMAVCDKNGSLVIANTAFSQLMEIDAEQLTHLDLFKIRNRVMDQTELKEQMVSALASGAGFHTSDIELITEGKTGRFYIEGEVITLGENQPNRLLLKCIQRR